MQGVEDNRKILMQFAYELAGLIYFSKGNIFNIQRFSHDNQCLILLN